MIYDFNDIFFQYPHYIQDQQHFIYLTFFNAILLNISRKS